MVCGSTRDSQSLEASAAGLMIRAGFGKAAERMFDERTLDGGDRLSRVCLPDLAAACLRREGKSPESFGSKDAMIRASFSTVEMPAALGLAGEKILLDAYEQAPSPWREWCKIVSVSSFREHTIFRPTVAGGFQQLAPGGEIKHANVTEETAEIKADTFAKILSIDRTQLINDDAGAFAQAAESLGKAAMRRLNDLVINTLLVGAGTFFTDGLGNLITDALSVAAVAKAVAIMRAAVDSDGDNLDIQPKALLVGPALESLAFAICNSEFIEATEGAPTGNSLKGVLTPLVDPRMANASLGGSANAWAVLAGPSDTPQAVAFLNGQSRPSVETLGLQAEIDKLAFHWRAYFDFGSALVDPRAGVLSTGAGGE